MIDSSTLTYIKSVRKGAFFYGSLLLQMLCSNLVLSRTELSVSQFSYSQPVSVYAFTHEWQGKLKNGEKAIGYFSYTLSRSVDQSSQVGISQITDVDITFSNETAQLFYFLANDVAIEQTRQFDVYLKANLVKRQSYWLKKMFKPGPGLSAAITFGLDKGVDLVDGVLKGQATIDGENGETEFLIDVDYSYGKDRLFFRDRLPLQGGMQLAAEHMTGYHFNFDLTLDKPDYQFELSAQDLMAVSSWKDAPYTQATADTNIQDRNQLGYIVLNPLIKGIEGFRFHRSQIKPKVYAALTLPFSKARFLNHPAALHFNGRWMYDTWFLATGVKLNYANDSHWQMLWYPRLASLEFSVKNRLFFSSISASEIDLKKAHFWALRLGLTLPY